MHRKQKPQARKVAEVVPLKQGLKLINRGIKNNTNSCCRGSSIKTRIETHHRQDQVELLEVVAEVVPLKQGLKPCNVLNVNLNIKGCRGSSIKTRIETATS